MTNNKLEIMHNTPRCNPVQARAYLFNYKSGAIYAATHALPVSFDSGMMMVGTIPWRGFTTKTA